MAVAVQAELAEVQVGGLAQEFEEGRAAKGRFVYLRWNPGADSQPCSFPPDPDLALKIASVGQVAPKRYHSDRVKVHAVGGVLTLLHNPGAPVPW